ncbi:hypothetical protein DL96DRAFT_886630 [Flagelloscypha sp. PMI_526]|nr:hypothetical protein DL96DRAFT_886630 [Flagelloscypha sp. PMI_526]
MCTAPHKHVDPPKRAAMENELGVYVHVHQLFNQSVRPYAMYSRFGLYADNIASEYQYIRPVSYGYDLPKNKRKRQDGKQHGTQLGGEVGMTNAKPTFKISGMKSLLTTSGNETTDEDVSQDWLVREGDDIEDEDSAFFQQFEIWQSHPSAIPQPNLEVEFGLSLEPLDKPRNRPSLDVVRPSCLYFHQLHVWVGSSKQPRGMIFIFAHHIPDICTDQPSSVRGSNIKIQINPILENSSAQMDVPSLTLSASSGDLGQSFGIASAIIPHENEKGSGQTRNMLRKQRKDHPDTGAAVLREVEVTRRTSHGWNHTHGEWLQILWPCISQDLKGTSENATRDENGPVFVLKSI